MKKHNILIDATGGSNWIGGLYYKKNILFSLMQSEYIVNNHSIIVATSKENVPIFSSFKEKIKIVELSYKHHKEKKLKLLFLCKKYSCKFVFPCSGGKIFHYFGIIEINWIPDFQHNYLKELFSEEERIKRSENFNRIAQEKNPLVLSSNECSLDLQKYYSNIRAKIFIVPFVSYIENEIYGLNIEKETIILKKYNLYLKKYVCIANQFWKHKNHIVVFEAIKQFLNKDIGKNDIKFVFTGKMEDYRHPDYIAEIEKYLEDNIVKEHVLILGFIEREEQLAIMKNAEYIIQPSLFEGWGTVVEDAKVLDKTIILSDIPIHREQMSTKSQLFNPHDPGELATIIESEQKKNHVSNIEYGIQNMYERAKEYSKEFEKIFQIKR